ncbi:MAG TPA: transketolase C-terminal domain-containing protein [Planctomycetota bacterium]|jgi:pyruvate dehydrogenase E1 component beta subunit
MAQQSYSDVRREVLAIEMRANPRMVIFTDAFAEDESAERLLKEFGKQRVRSFERQADMIVGAALGAVLAGCRAVVELGSMSTLAGVMGRLSSDAGSRRYCSGGTATVALTIRAGFFEPDANAASFAPALENWLAATPGVLVAAPATLQDAAGLLRSALREENPVVLLEHPAMKNAPAQAPVEEQPVPLGSAALRRSGKDLTVISYGRMAPTALAACEQVAADGIEAEMIDLRSLKPLDLSTVLESVRKTGRVLLCSAAPGRSGFISELAMSIIEHGFDDLDAPIRRLCAPEVTAPLSAALAAYAVPSQVQIAEGIRGLARE